VRVLLDLVRENEAAAPAVLRACQDVLRDASLCLEILHPGRGEKELIKLVAAELVNPREIEKNKLPGVPTGVPRP